MTFYPTAVHKKDAGINFMRLAFQLRVAQAD